MTKEEWKRRYVERFISVTDGTPDAGSTREELRKIGEADFEAAGYETLIEGFEEDPEGAADESMSYYD